MPKLKGNVAEKLFIKCVSENFKKMYYLMLRAHEMFTKC